jgi:regulatory protein
VHEVIDELRAKGLQSDERFTEAFVHGRIDRGYGPLRISQELKQRGVCDHLISQYLHGEEFDWWQRAAEIREKRFGETLPADYKDRAKQSRFLQSRGFSPEQIRHLFKPGDE